MSSRTLASRRRLAYQRSRARANPAGSRYPGYGLSTVRSTAYRPLAGYLPRARTYRTMRRVTSRRTPSMPMYKRVKGLLDAKTRDATDISYANAALTLGTLVQCLTSSSNSTMAYGTGLLQTDADEVLINSVRIRGVLYNPARVVADPTGNVSSQVRRIVVWFNKPLNNANNGGTNFPGLLEVLAVSSIEAMPVQRNNNAGRFTILSDRIWDLGVNTFQSTAAAGHARVTGKTVQFYDYTVKVGRKCSFKTPSSPGAAAGGHYDLSQSAGQITTGLLIMYTLYAPGSGGVTTIHDIFSRRLNFTG